MSTLTVLARAPSNIAIVKYMGKRPGPPANLPENPSLSMTLDALCTVVELRRSSSSPAGLVWERELPRATPELPLQTPSLSPEGLEKIRRHLLLLDAELPAILGRFGLTCREPGTALVLRSANTFPPASGIASSASAFAAITLAGAMSWAQSVERFAEAWDREPGLKRALTPLSRQGSGSSCRSFEGPWVRWSEHAAEQIPCVLPELSHFVLLVSSSEKPVSSSAAHQRVRSSPLWNGRIQRATERVEQGSDAVRTGDFERLARIAWADAWEMHSLFHTSAEPFTYWKPQTVAILDWFAAHLSAPPAPLDIPLVTLDAGPNVHVIVPRSNAAAWRARIRERFPEIPLLEDRPGSGARPLFAHGGPDVGAV